MKSVRGKMPTDASRRLAAEALGTALLLVAVVGSGIMAQRLSGGNAAIALLANAIATGAALVVLISVFAPLSGAHFNPAVTVYSAMRCEMTWHMAGAYIFTQCVAAIIGVWITHAMFAMPLWEVSGNLRNGPSQWLAEFIATLGLLIIVAGAMRIEKPSTPMLIGLYITGAYWFTASTSFANPAVTLARIFTDSFSGIAPVSAPGFIAAQLAATAVAAMSLKRLFGADKRRI